MRSRRAEREERAQRDELVERLHGVATQLSVDLQLPAVLGRIVSGAAALVDADAAGFVLVEPDGPVLAAVHGLPESLVGYRYPRGEGVIWDAMETGEPV